MADEVQTFIHFAIGAGKEAAALSSKLTAKLKRAGFRKPIANATWEHEGIGAADLAHFLNEFWGTVGSHDGRARVEDFWMHANRERATTKTP